MKHWRVVHFATPAEVERYLNGLSIQPDQIKGVFASPAAAADGTGGVILVCWLSAHQQRIEQLQRRPPTDEDRAPEARGESAAFEPPREPPRGQPRGSRRRSDDEQG